MKLQDFGNEFDFIITEGFSDIKYHASRFNKAVYIITWNVTGRENECRYSSVEVRKNIKNGKWKIV